MRGVNNLRKQNQVSPWLYLLGLGGSIFLFLPLLVVVLVSFSGERYVSFPPENWSLQWYQNLWYSAKWWTSFVNSIFIAAMSAILSTFMGFWMAYSIGKLPARKSLWLNGLILFPLITPPVIYGVAFLLSYAPLGLNDTALGIIVGHVVLATPYAFIIGLTAYSRMDLKMETTALSLGASHLYTIYRILIPHLKKSGLISFLVCFLISFDESVMVLFISGTEVKTLPRQILDGIRFDMDPMPAVITVLMIFFVALLFVISQKAKK